MDAFRPPPASHQGVLRDLGLGASSAALIEAVKAGLPVDTFTALARRLRVSEATLAGVVGLSGSTLARRKRAGTLTPAESEHVLRVAALLDRGAEVFGSEADAAEWMTTTNVALGNLPPLSLADTELGAREVEDLLGRLEHGVYS
jgi:putative toxin-antitoxin system antitoxin component (TIGR02293 family)